jgi:hypothetical protein
MTPGVQANLPRQSGGTYLGIFLVSMSVLIFQVALTRIFAIMMWYHFAYLVISLALLGFGASGSLLTLLRLEQRRESDINRFLGVASLGFGLAILASFFSITQIQIDTFTIWKSPKSFLGLAAIFSILAVPFLLGGMAIGTCLTRYSRNVSRLYFADLLGAALGAVLCPLLLAELGQTTAVMLASALALLGSVAFTEPAFRMIRLAGVVSCASTLALAVGFSGGWKVIPPLEWDIPFAPNKKAAQLFDRFEVETVIPSATAQVDITVPVRMPLMMGGEFGAVDKAITTARVVTQDGTAPTFLFEDSSNLARYPQLDDTQAASGYVVLDVAGRRQPDVMVIGVGGGIDVMVALYHEARNVTAVELNKAMIEMGTGVFSGFIGDLFDDPRVTIFNEDGRTHLQRTDVNYDIIQLSGVDTFTALSTGAYTLSESYLYTLEAIQRMYARLNRDGVINFSRFIIEERPRETIRLANTAYHALEALGIPSPDRHIAILQAREWASTMVKQSPFTAEEIAALERFAEVEEFGGLAFNPLIDEIDEIHGTTASQTRMRRTFFSVLKGSAAERQAFVDNYYYDLEPAVDDRPFFFNYYRLSTVFDSQKDFADHRLGEYLPNFPVGHMVLLSALLIIATMAIALILMPLRFLERYHIEARTKISTFAYFCSLGLGFMFIEIGMMQKFILFLGHPIYSMSVVLGGILAFSGLGALFSGLLSPSRAVIRRLMGAIVLAILFSAFGLSPMLELFQGSSLTIRILLALVLLAPTAFVLGMPFPMGIKMLEQTAPQLIPWGWAINGFSSVLSSIVVIALAMVIGFSNVVMLAGLIYGLGMALAPLPPQRAGI